jgi:hypothetical protein
MKHQEHAQMLVPISLKPQRQQSSAAIYSCLWATLKLKLLGEFCCRFEVRTCLSKDNLAIVAGFRNEPVSRRQKRGPGFRAGSCIRVEEGKFVFQRGKILRTLD